MENGDWRSWFERRTYGPPDPDLDELRRAKAASGQSVSVCLPALNEETTISAIVQTVVELRDAEIVDEVFVSDSGSRDNTRILAIAAGAEIVSEGRLDLPRQPNSGKGGALWRGAAHAQGDILLFLDTDVINFGPHFVTRLLAPLLVEDEIVLAKAFYERPMAKGDGSLGPGGARVTEVAMRPLLQILFPEMTGLVQPLGGECAIRRQMMLEIPIVSGYGVEAGLLVDVVQRHGVDALAQVDLGVRVHRNRREALMGQTAFQVIEGLLLRLDHHGLVKLRGELPNDYVRFDSNGDPIVTSSGVSLLPPLIEVMNASR